jgi:hypothetical protein
MKLASQVQRTDMYLNDKELSSWRLKFPVYMDFTGKRLIILNLCASPYIKKHDCLLSWNYVSPFNGRDKGFRRHQSTGLTRAAITMSAEIVNILLIRR